MATDFWGQPLQIGDRVSYMERHYRQLRHGTIINLGKKQATIQTEMYQDHPTLKDQMGYGKTCRDYSCIIREPKKEKLIPLTLEELKLMKGKYIWWDASYGGYCLCRDTYVITENATYSLDWVVTHGHAYKTKPQNA